MHALSPYTFRCFNKDLVGTQEQKYCLLNDIKGHDLYDLLKGFIQSHSDSYTILEEDELVFQFSHMAFQKKTREIIGFFNVGHYGMATDIINVETGEVDFEKATNNAEIIQHYIHFFIPDGVNEAMAFMHSYRGKGSKTIFYTEFAKYFFAATRLSLQMHPLPYDKALSAWLDAAAKEVRLTKYEGASDISDSLSSLGHHEKELVIKAPRRSNLGKLRDYVNKDSAKFAAIEMMEGYGSQVKTTVEMGGRTRTFCVGNNAHTPLCEIEFDDDIEYVEGVPQLDSINSWVTGIINEYIQALYPEKDLKV